MTGDPSGQALMAAELDHLFLDAKLTIPQPQVGSVSRAGLIEAARTRGSRVVALTAPAGYGKSTLLAQWAAAEDRSVAWVSLDRFDDDPVVLLSLLAAAYARIGPDAAELAADMGGPGVSVLGRAAPHLASVLRTSPVPFVFMVDDLHEIRAPDCHDVLGVVIAGIPRGSQFVAASRAEQPHLPQFRASGDTAELVASDLALDAAEAQQIFAQEHVDVTSDLAAAVTERTEGWPVGLYFSAVIARESGGDALAIAGDDRFVADYLYRESMRFLPEDTQQFLRRTAVLDQLCAPLCDAVLRGSGSQQRLRDLEASNHFLVPLDRRRKWYRYHALFREFLLAEQRRIEPDSITSLNLRAADWYEASGSMAMALEHMLNASDEERCVRLMTRLVLPTYQAGQVSTVERWLATVGNSVIEQHPPLAVLAGWVAVLSGQTAEAERWAAILEAVSYDAVPTDGTASFASARAMLRATMCAAGPEKMLVDTNFAVAQEPSWSPWRDTALGLCAEAHLLTGDVRRAAGLFAKASAAAVTSGNAGSLVFSEAQLAQIAMDQGRWAEAAERTELARAAIEKNRLHDYAISVLAFVSAARLEVHRGNSEEADRQLNHAMRARPSCTSAMPSIAVRVRLRLAKLYLARADTATAQQLVGEIDDVLDHCPELGALVAEVAVLRDLVASSVQRGVAGGAPLSPAELRLLPYLQTHLTISEIGERLFVTRNTINSEVTSIYRKLGVSSRNHAVQRATAIGLLGG